MQQEVKPLASGFCSASAVFIGWDDWIGFSYVCTRPTYAGRQLNTHCERYVDSQRWMCFAIFWSWRACSIRSVLACYTGTKTRVLFTMSGVIVSRSH